MEKGKKYISKMNGILGNFYTTILSYIYNRQYKKMYQKTCLSKKDRIVLSKRDIARYKEKWGKIASCVNPIYLNLFSNYIGKNLDIVPEDICHRVVETILDPPIYRAYYADKNMFDKILPLDYMAKTYLRRIQGSWYDVNYEIVKDSIDNLISNIDDTKIVIKPTVGGMSGKGVKLFAKEGRIWRSLDSRDILSQKWLDENYGNDCIIQRCLGQSKEISYYNPTSVNTLRLAVYRSVKDDEVHVLRAVMRIGGKGSLIDNAHAGGGFVGIYKDGTLGKFVCNQYGETTNIFNDIDFGKPHKVPYYDKVIDFAKDVARHIPHHRLLALDIMLDENNNPRLIEFNVEKYSVWLFQFTTGGAFGEFTDEIIDYCAEHKKEIKSEYLYL